MAPQGNSAPTAATDPIKHVVVLMMENRSFDHMLGYLQQMKDSVYSKVDGIPAAGVRSNPDNGNALYSQMPGAARQIAKDPNLSLIHI